MDTTMRTSRPETSKRREAQCHSPSQFAGSSQKDLNSPIPKELGLPSLEKGMLDS